MDAISACYRESGIHRRRGQAHSGLITAIFTLLEIVLVGLVIASLIAIAITSQVADYFPSVRFNASPNPQASRVF
jgi:hypothetical protein